jgi:hypothetical protein
MVFQGALTIFDSCPLGGKFIKAPTGHDYMKSDH